MHRQAYHLDLGLELRLAAGGVPVLEPLDGHQGSVLQLPLVHVPEAALAQDVLAAEVVGRDLQLPELEPSQVAEAEFFLVLLWRK